MTAFLCLHIELTHSAQALPSINNGYQEMLVTSAHIDLALCVLWFGLEISDLLYGTMVLR